MVNLLTYNVKGLQNKTKRAKIFTFLDEKLQNNGIFCLQETHSTPSCEEVWKKEYDGTLLFSHGSSNQKGVIIGFSKNVDAIIEKTTCDKKGRILIVDLTLDLVKYTLINLYNANTEAEQINTLNSLADHLLKHNINQDRHPILMGDLNLIFDIELDALGGNPALKKRSIAALIKITESLDTSDIFRIRNPNTKRFTFRQKSKSNQTTHRRLDYVFLSTSLQEFARKIEILPSFLSDHSPVLLSLQKNVENVRGKGLWKFNNSHLQDNIFITNIKDVIRKTLADVSKTNFSPHLTWEILKYEIRKSCIKYSKDKARLKKCEKIRHEKIILNFENNPLPDDNSNKLYLDSKFWLENWYDELLKGSIMRSKATCYENGEKSSKYFLNLEKRNSVKNTIRKLFIVNDKNEEVESENESDILNHARNFYQNLYKRKSNKNANSCSLFLNNIPIPSITDEQKESCEKEITIKELSESLADMSSGKSPGNDGLTCDFYKVFWTDLQLPLFNSFIYAKHVGELSTSQRQAIIKLLEKSEKDKRYIENWRPISLLNTDTKIISKTIASRLKNVLPTIISHDQTAYVKGRFIGESTRLISDILEITDSLNIPGYILTADIEKAFDSMDHTFLLAILSKVGFGDYFIDWIKILLNKNESCVLNGGSTSQYIKLQRGARQGDPIAAYLFTIALEVFFIMVRTEKRIKGIEIFDYTFLLSAYADDTTFFVSDTDSIHEIFRVFNIFSRYSGFTLNKSKCEVSGIGVKKGVKTAFCNVKNINLVLNSMKVLGVYYSYDKDKCQSKNFTSVIEKMEKVLNIWKSRQLSIEGKIVIFKTLAISKIVYISHKTTVSEFTLSQLEKIQKDFLWKGKRAKIKHSTIIGDYCSGGLRDVDIRSKIKSLQLSWIKRLFDNNFHPWKIIPSKLFSNFFFYPNRNIDSFFSNGITPKFYRNIVLFWKEVSDSLPITVSSILSECIYYNNLFKIENNIIKPSFLGSKNLLFVADFFDKDGRQIDWECFKQAKKLNQIQYFKWLQLVNSIPSNWKQIIKQDKGDARIFCDFSPHLNTNAKIFPINKLSSNELYKILINSLSRPPTSQSRIMDILQSYSLPWKEIYILPRKVTIDTYSRVFHYKCLNNILYLNNSLFKMGLVPSPLCSLCKNENETFSHLFYECGNTKTLWQELQVFFKSKIAIPNITLQCAYFGFYEITKEYFILFNTILLNFKITLFQRRDKQKITISEIVNDIRKREVIERIIAFDNIRKKETHTNKWKPIQSLLIE